MKKCKKVTAINKQRTNRLEHIKRARCKYNSRFLIAIIASLDLQLQEKKNNFDRISQVLFHDQMLALRTLNFQPSKFKCYIRIEHKMDGPD